MKKLLKKLTAMLLCGIMLLSVVSCSKDKDDKTTGGGGGGDEWWTTVGELTFNADNTVKFDRVQIDLTSIVTGADKSALESLVAQFNSEYHNKIKINLTTLNQGDYDKTVSQQIANKTNAPQLLMCHQKSVKAFADNKLLQPFNEALEKSKIGIDLADYSAALAQYAGMGYTDYTFGIPVDAQTCVVLVNQEMLLKYRADGVIPSTHSGIVDLLKEVKAGEGTGNALAWSTGDDFFSTYVFMTALLQNGVSLYNEQSYRADWYSNESQRANFTAGVASIQDFVNQGVAKYNVAEGNSYQAFYDNKALFLVCMPWNVPEIIEEYRKANSIDAARDTAEYVGATSLAGWFTDNNSAEKSLIYGDSHFFAMSKHVTSIEEKAAILEFIRWYTQTTSASIEWGKAGHVSAYLPVAESAAYKNDHYINHYISKFYGDVNHFRSIGITPYHMELTGRLGVLFAGIDDAGANISALIQDAEKRYNEDVEIAEMAK